MVAGLWLNKADRNRKLETRNQGNYSQRNATIGSTFVARRAGNQQGSSATRLNSKMSVMKVSGSAGLTPAPREPLVVHSHLNATIGSTFVARRAGK